jgi:hypothetical protein
MEATMPMIPIDQQIAELRAELAHTHLTKRERQDAQAELEWLEEQHRIESEAAYFAWIDHEAESLPRSSAVLDRLPF